MLRSLRVTAAQLLCGLVVGGGWVLGGSRGAIADEVGCYMTTSDGMTISLAHICGANVPTGAYLADPEPIPSYAVPAQTPYAAPPRPVASVSQSQRDVSQELPFLSALPPLPPLEEF